MAKRFDPSGEVYSVQNVRCSEVFTTKTGKTCAKIVWEGGTKLIFDEDTAKKMTVDTRYNIKANISYGEKGQMFLDAIELETVNMGRTRDRAAA